LDVYTRHYRVSGTSLATLVAVSTLTSPTLRTTIGAGPVDVVDSSRELGSVGISPRAEGGLIVSRSRFGFVLAQGGVVKSLRRAVSVSALACGLALVTSSTAVAAIPPVLISGPSPYAACSQFDNSLTGRTFPNAEVEPQAAVHGGTAIAMWHQDRRSNGGARGIGVGYSTNGGAPAGPRPLSA
jgi:hypothetical protein